MKYRLTKRIFDLVMAIVGLVLSVPIFVVITLLIWLDEPGNVLFSQTRLGLRGKPFRLLKFRKFSSRCGDKGPAVTVTNDARMTGIGAIIERTKLDELPQLWNIVKGDMSFVGPRPESLRFADMYQGVYIHLLEFLPGLFGPCQIAFRNESSLYPEDEDPEIYYRRVLFHQKAMTDLAYFQKANLIEDMYWIAKGLWITLVGAADWRVLLKFYGKTVVRDISIVLVSWVVATILRFSDIPSDADYPPFIFGLWILPPSIIVGLIIGGCYRHYGEGYFVFNDAVRLIYSATVSLGLAFMAILAFESRTTSFYLLPIAWLALLTGLAIPRVWSRLKREKTPLTNRKANGTPIVIYGANINGIALSNWFSQVGGRRVLAFLDDKPNVRGKQLMGLPVLQRHRDILTLRFEEKNIEVWVAHRLQSAQKMKLVEFCDTHELRLVLLSESEAFAEMTKVAA